MNGNCHFVVGACTGFVASAYLGLDAKDTTLLISTCLIGSIFPDIDNPKSNFGQLTKPVSTIIGKIHEIMHKEEWQHRGMFHDIFLYILGLFIAYKVFNPLIGFFIGAISHLILDCFNPSGIPFLLGYKRMRLGKILSESTESVLFSGFIAITLVTIGILIKLS